MTVRKSVLLQLAPRQTTGDGVLMKNGDAHSNRSFPQFCEASASGLQGKSGERICGRVCIPVGQSAAWPFDARLGARPYPKQGPAIGKTEPPLRHKAWHRRVDKAVQRSLLKVIENIDLRPPKAAARRSCGIVSV